MKKLLVIVLSFFALTLTHAENDKAFFWKVSTVEGDSDAATVYLMGSIHFADKSFYPLRKEIVQAFDQSDYLVVELDINKVKSEAYNNILLKKGIYKDGKTVEDVLTKETLSQLRERLTKLNVSYDAVKNYKPGMLVLTLSAIQVTQMGFQPDLGIDAYFLNKAAQQTGKQIIELETLAQQLDLFIDIPDSELLLKESLYSLDESEVLMADMVRLWKQGDETKMNTLLFEDSLDDFPEFNKIYDSLFYARNNKMTSKINDMLKQQGSYFVVVGSGHLIGEKGIVNALKEKGYDVERR
jgi:uncharacterized protein YbaP (TraB family)